MRHRRTTTVVFLSLVLFTLATPAQDLKLMGELADRGAWKEAHALCRQMARVAASHGQHSATELRRLRLLDSALSQAASQRRQYGAAWEQLGRYDKALQYYDAKIASDTDKVWPLAHNAGLIAARQGDWAKVSYFFRLLEKHGMDWSAKQGKARAEIADRYRQNPDDPDRLIELATKFWVTSIPFTGTDYPAALACFESALDLTSDKKKRAEIYRHVLDYAGRNNDAATIQTWRERAANETEPDNNLVAQFTIALGNESLRKHDLHEAQRHFSTVVQNMSDTRAWPDAVYSLGQIHQKSNAYQQAINTYNVLLKRPIKNRDSTTNSMLAYRHMQHNACAGISQCYESLLDFDKAREFHTRTNSKFGSRGFCGTCARSIAQQHKARHAILTTLASLKQPSDDVIVRLCVNYCRQTGLLSKAIVARFPKRIGRQLFLDLIGQTKAKRVELLGMLQQTGLSGVTTADWTRLFRAASVDTQFAAVSLLYNTSNLSAQVANVLSDQFAIAIQKGDTRVANAIGRVLNNSGGDALEALTRQLDHPNEKVRHATRSNCRYVRDVTRHSHVVAAVLKGLADRPLPEQRQCVYLLSSLELRPQDATLIADALLTKAALPELREQLDALCGPRNKQTVDWKSTLQLTPLMLAVECAEIANIEQLAKTDSVHDVDYRGDTALIRAMLNSKSTNVEVVAALIRGGAPLDARGNRHTTALLEAVRAHNTEALKMLLAAGADPNLHTSAGDSALRLALQKGYLLLADAILESKVDLKANYGNNRTALIEFCRINDVALVRRALELGAAVNAVDAEKKSALIWAVKSDPSSTVIPRVLLARGAMSTMRDNSGKTAADYAQSPALAELLND